LTTSDDTDPIDPEPVVYIQLEMHRIWHHFHLNDCIAVCQLLFQNQALEQAPCAATLGRRQQGTCSYL
jgi:hypothetical protein